MVLIELYLSINFSILKGLIKMKKILCALIACAVCASVSLGLSGCGCSDNNQNSNQPGYVVPTTEPDLKSDDFGFFIINQNELMITTYLGSDKDVVIPESFNNYQVTVIGHSVFHNKNITSVEMPDTIKEIQDYSFANNKNLRSVKLSKKLKVIGTNAFWYCKSLETIEFPSSLEKVDVYAFSASGLKSITIPESSTFNTIDQYTFYQCPNLTEVTLPASMTNIADNAFADCPNDLTFKVLKGSYGLNYAKTNNFKYEEIQK